MLMEPADPRSPLPVFADCEQLDGRLRAFVPVALFRSTCDKRGHDGGDEDWNR